MNFLKRLISLRLHKHDFELIFPDNDNDPLAWKFRCKCGLATTTLSDAVQYQGKWTIRCSPS